MWKHDRPGVVQAQHVEGTQFVYLLSHHGKNVGQRCRGVEKDGFYCAGVEATNAVVLQCSRIKGSL